MTPSERFDRQLPEILEEISQPRTPDYFDDLLGQTASMRQRPAWTLPERWLPMADIARQPAFARQVPWRQIAVLALIVLLLAAGLVLVIGSRPRVPAPFGLARNGLVAYAQGGDIYTADPVSGAATAVVTGAETDLRPVFSLDGTRMAFERKANGSGGPGRLFVANADGSGLTQVTPEPIGFINSYAFSPDGQEILISTGPEGMRAILVAKTDGTATRSLDVGSLEAIDPTYRAPDGREVIFVGHASGTRPSRRPVRRAAGRQRAAPDRRPDEPAHAGTQVLARWQPDRVRRAPGRLRHELFPVAPRLRRRSRGRDPGDAARSSRPRMTSRPSPPGRTTARACSSPAAVGPRLVSRTAHRRWPSCRPAADPRSGWTYRGVPGSWTGPSKFGRPTTAQF